MMGWLTPVPLDPNVHDVARFTSGNPVLDEWLRRYAAMSHASGAARIYVSATAADPTIVAGYHCLSTVTVAKAQVTERIATGMPDPVPAVLLGRLAVDVEHQGAGLGSGLLRDAIERIVVAAGAIGVRVLLVHAIDEDARRFYLHHEFEPSPTGSMYLLLLLKDARRLLRREGQ